MTHRTPKAVAHLEPGDPIFYRITQQGRHFLRWHFLRSGIWAETDAQNPDGGGNTLVRAEALVEYYDLPPKGRPFMAPASTSRGARS